MSFISTSNAAIQSISFIITGMATSNTDVKVDYLQFISGATNVSASAFTCLFTNAGITNCTYTPTSTSGFTASGIISDMRANWRILASNNKGVNIYFTGLRITYTIDTNVYAISPNLIV